MKRVQCDEQSGKELSRNAASHFGRLGGLQRTEAKAKAARINGLKGGRPKSLTNNQR